MTGDGGTGVDFVVGPDREPAPETAGTLRPARRRFAPRLLLALFVLAAAVVATARLTATRPAARPHAHTSRSVPAVAPGPLDPDACRIGVRCTTVDAVPQRVYAAISTAFPASSAVSGSSVLVDDGRSGTALWFRSVQAATERSDISIRISHPRRTDRDRATRDPDGIGRVISTMVVQAHRLLVEVVVTTNDATAPPSFATLRSLAADRRLVVLR